MSGVLLLSLLGVSGGLPFPVPDRVPENSAVIVLGEDTSGDRPEIFRASSYTLNYASAMVAQGSYSGLRVSFSTPDRGSDHYELTLFIPSHAGFGVGHDSAVGSFVVESPETPFVLRSEDCADIKDRFGRPRPMTVELLFMKRTGKNHWSPRSIIFDTCRISVEKLSVEGGRLVFSGGFECFEGDSAAAGRFDVVSGELGLSKVVGTGSL